MCLTTDMGGKIKIGHRVFINFGASISSELDVTLGDRVSLGPYVRIADSGSDGGPEPVRIGDDVWLATRVEVTKGSVIGAGTVVAAGSVVRGELPPGVLAGGVPARVLRTRSPGMAQPGGPTRDGDAARRQALAREHQGEQGTGAIEERGVDLGQ
ncbi:MAG: acyltransferase [Polyangiaceae bacterium]